MMGARVDLNAPELLLMRSWLEEQLRSHDLIWLSVDGRCLCVKRVDFRELRLVD